jgi:predicted TIM-barrel fold metal-dependent hydrolase
MPLPETAPMPRGRIEYSRREFLAVSTAPVFSGRLLGQSNSQAREPVIDIHQHIVYNDRTVQQLIAHQRTMGVTTSVLLPTGDRGEGHPGGSGDHEAVLELCRTHPGEFVFFANEISDHAEAPRIIERQLRRGAIGIGEQKFRVDCDSPDIERIAAVARSFDVPVLLHFQHGVYNRHIERFHRILEKFPTVNFIGHAQAWWGNIHKNHDQTDNYPRGLVTPGGITDRYLSDYPNCYADLSAGSGYNAITRDEDRYREFIVRHQNKLVYGSDCSEATGRRPECVGANILAAIRRLTPNKAIERKILYENAKRLLKLRGGV